MKELQARFGEADTLAKAKEYVNGKMIFTETTCIYSQKFCSFPIIFAKILQFQLKSFF